MHSRAAPAAASSIAYIKEGNVWLISPDGSRDRQVTTDATDTTAYNWPSQADDGTILAKRGDYFVRHRRPGRPLHRARGARPPDGSALAVTESDGIHVFEPIPDLRAGAAGCSQIQDRLLVRGAMPGWGPADVPKGSGPAPGPLSGLTVARRQRGRSVRVKLQVPAAGSTVRVRLLAGKRRRVLGGAVERGAAAGPLALDARLNRRGRAALRARRRLALTVRVGVTPPGGG